MICVASIAAMASAASAQPERVATSIRVSDLGVDFSNPTETAAFYADLGTAARKACDSGMDRNLAILSADQRCAQQALDRAVRETGRSTLAALHEQKTGRPAPATMLAAQ